MMMIPITSAAVSKAMRILSVVSCLGIVVPFVDYCFGLRSRRERVWLVLPPAATRSVPAADPTSVGVAAGPPSGSPAAE